MAKITYSLNAEATEDLTGFNMVRMYQFQKCLINIGFEIINKGLIFRDTKSNF